MKAISKPKQTEPSSPALIAELLERLYGKKEWNFNTYKMYLTCPRCGALMRCSYSMVDGISQIPCRRYPKCQYVVDMRFLTGFEKYNYPIMHDSNLLSPLPPHDRHVDKMVPSEPLPLNIFYIKVNDESDSSILF